MPGFKIADAYVAVNPQDDGFEVDLRALVDQAAANVQAKIGLGVSDDAPEQLRGDVEAAADLVGEGVHADVGLGLRNDAVEELDADVKAGVDLVEQDAKVKVGVDPKSADDAKEGMSKLILAAIAGAVAVGPAALLGVLGAAATGATALVLRQNAVIAKDYTQLGKTAQQALQQAAAPLTGTMHQALQSVASDVSHLEPLLATAFAAAQPDVMALTRGVEGLVNQALPGVAAGLQGGQADVAAFAGALPQLGSGIGGFFSGLTKDSTTTADGLQSVFGVVSNLLSTVGAEVGDASTAVSAALLGIDPVLNTTLSLVRAVSNPVTVGAAGGLFAAWKVDPAVSSGLQKVSNGLTSVAAKTEGAGGLLGRFSGAAEGAAGGLGTMADVMGGPWGLAVGAGVGLVAGLVGSMISASSATRALTLDQEGLGAAIAQDGGKAGEATTAFIAQQAVTDGLSKSAAKAGVSLATWTQAVVGNRKAQEAVTAAVEKSNQAADNQIVKQDQSADATSRAAEDMQGATTTVDAQRAATNALTDSNAQLLNSLKAQEDQVASTIAQQTQLTEAQNALSNATAILSATLANDRATAVQTAQGTAQTTLAALGFTSAQNSGVQALYKAVTAYQLSSGAANAYGSALNSLYGKFSTYSEAEAQFTTDLGTATSQLKRSKDGFDASTVAGAANFQVMDQLAQANAARAQALINEGQSQDAATQAYREGAQAMDDLAKKAGFTQTQIEQLNKQLYGVPKIVDITFDGDTGPAKKALASLVQEIDTSHGTVRVDLGGAGGARISVPGRAYADGGFVDAPAGQPVPATVHGEEYVLSQGMLAGRQPVDQRVLSALSASRTAGPVVNVTQIYQGPHMPDGEQRAVMLRELATVGGLG